jgi:hypothetical protein
MQIDRMTVDLWRGTKCEQEEIRDPRVEEFTLALDSLDGGTRTILCLYCANGHQLVIGGGDNGYIVDVAFSEMEFWNLLSDVDRGQPIQVTAGGNRATTPPGT